MRPNAKLTGWAALLLFGLGMLSVLLVYLRNDASPETVRLVLGAAVLLSLGCASMPVAGVQRLEARVAELEQKLGAKPPAE